MAEAKFDPRKDMRVFTRYVLNDPTVWSEKDIRREYSRLRDIAHKRLQRLERSEPESYAYKQNVGQYAPARELSTGEIKDLLPDLARFITAKAGSVSGIRSIRKQTLETLHKRGYTFVNKKNLREFGDYMEQFRARKELHSIGSVEAAEFYGWTVKHKIPIETVKENFSKWVEHREALRNFAEKKSKATEEVSSDMIIKDFERLAKEKK